jgi:SAM-dependent methyltransferase
LLRQWDNYSDTATFQYSKLLELHVIKRSNEPELLDQGVGSLQDVQCNLADMWRINRYAGGLHALTRHLYPRLRQHHEHTITVVDVGCGAANLGVFLVKWAQRNQIDLRLFAVDIAARNLTIARQNTENVNDVHVLQADAERLPFPVDRVDYVISCLLLHHLTPSAIVTLLRQYFELVSSGIIMSDLVRGWQPMLAFRIMQPAIARHYLTAHDGMLSIRRAYVPDELRMLTTEAELFGAQVYEHFPWRMTLVVDK